MSDRINLINIESELKYGYSKSKATGIFPNILPDPLNLNLGCGRDIKEDFLNIDIFSDNPIVINCDARYLPLPDKSVDSIIANDLIEMFSHREIDNILVEWFRVLKNKGTISIRCGNLEQQIKNYNDDTWDADIFSYMLFGGHTNILDYRNSCYDIKSLSHKLVKAGFEITNVQEHNYKQDRGLINQKFTITAIRNEIENIELTEEDLTEDFDNSIIEEQSDYLLENANIIENVIENSVDTDEYDYSYLLDEKQTEEVVNLEEEIINQAAVSNQKQRLSFFSIDEELKLFDDTSRINKEEIKTDDFDDYDIGLLSEIVNGTYFEEINISKSLYELNIVWEGSQFVYHSLALINREHCYNIINADVANVTIIPYEDDTFDFNQSDKYKLLAENDIRYKKEVADEITKLPYCWIRHQWPPKSEPPQGAKWIIIQPWEFSSLRADFVDIFNHADEIWTPSNYSRKAFINSGVDFDKVQVIPNGINPRLFTPYGNKYKLNTNKRIKFLYVGGTIYRKGIDILLTCFLKSFTNESDVCLVIKDMGGKSFYKGQTNKKMIDDFRNVRNAPEIIYIDDDLTENEMSSLYRACDILVSPYRGEGFSLPTLEAMACGLPVIVTEGGSTDDFVQDTFCWYIPSEQKSIGTMMDGKPFTQEAFLLEPDQNQFIEILKNIAQSANLLKQKGMLAQFVARSEWTWEQATLKILSRIDYLYGTSMRDKAQLKLDIYDDASIMVGDAEANYIGGDFDSAMQLFKDALKIGNLTDEYKLHAIHRLAIMAIYNNHFEECDSLIDSAEEIEYNHPDTRYVKIIKLASEKRNHEAMEMLSKLIEDWENVFTKTTLGNALDGLLVLMGDLFFAEGEVESAHKVYTTVLKINNENEFACYGAGMCFKVSGIKEHARSMFEWALKLNPDFKQAEDELNLL